MYKSGTRTYHLHSELSVVAQLKYTQKTCKLVLYLQQESYFHLQFQVGGVTQQQMTVYEEFARSIPGFLPPQPGQVIEPFPKPLPENQPTLLSQSDVHVTDSHKVSHIITPWCSYLYNYNFALFEPNIFVFNDLAQLPEGLEPPTKS